MKHIKAFENLSGIEIGDYVICDEMFLNEKLKNFLDNNIGQYVSHKPWSKAYPYLIQYNNIPDELLDDFIKDYTLNRYYTIIAINQ